MHKKRQPTNAGQPHSTRRKEGSNPPNHRTRITPHPVPPRHQTQTHGRGSHRGRVRNPRSADTTETEAPQRHPWRGPPPALGRRGARHGVLPAAGPGTCWGGVWARVCVLTSLPLYQQAYTRCSGLARPSASVSSRVFGRRGVAPAPRLWLCVRWDGTRCTLSLIHI